MNTTSSVSKIAVATGLLFGAFALSAIAQSSPVGTWSGATCAAPGCNAAAPLNVDYVSQTRNGPLWLEGLTGSGVVGGYSLVTENAPLKASGGFVVETRASDPSSPETGRIWLINP